jgi:hypothetical protein
MYPGTTGRDHLGLGEVSSGQILRSLSPSINVATIHPRYHSFYVFLLDEFWRRDRPRSHRAWVRFYRPREFIFSVAANLCEQPEHGNLGSIVGSDRTQSLAAARPKTFDTTTNYIKTELGGYGLYYGSVMAEVGLVYPGGRGLPTPVDVPSERGKELAAAFRRAVESSEYYKKHFGEDETSVPIGVVKEYGARACLCQLQKGDAPDRDLLRRVFLQEGLNPDARRETLRFFLDVANQTKSQPVDQDTFRQLVFYGAAEQGGTYKPRREVESTHRKWRLYQAREYYAFALNALWYYLCEWGEAQGGCLRPVAIEDFWAHLEKAIDLRKLAKRFDMPAPGLAAASDLRQLNRWLLSTAGTTEADFDSDCGIDYPIREHALYEAAIDPDDAPDVMTAGMLCILALTYLRFAQNPIRDGPEWAVARMGAEARLSMEAYLGDVRRRLDRGPLSVMEFAKWLYSSYVILQHQLVATRKLPENTFRFRRQGDRLQFYPLRNTLVFNDSRFTALSYHVHELGFCGAFTEEGHGLTPDGRKLLKDGALP